MKKLPPPTNPIYGGLINWHDIESNFNIKLPRDYKELIEVYGSGAVDNFVWLLNPISNNKNLNFDTVDYIYSSYQVMKDLFPDDFTRPKFPNKLSFFPWAVTDNGDTFVWIVDHDDPNDWSVGILGEDETDVVYTNVGTVEFLLKLISKEIISNALPDDFPSDNVRFVKKVFSV